MNMIYINSHRQSSAANDCWTNNRMGVYTGRSTSSSRV